MKKKLKEKENENMWKMKEKSKFANKEYQKERKLGNEGTGK